MMKKLFLVFMVLSIFVISCGKTGEKTETGKGTKGTGKKIAVNLQSEPKTLDPQLATDASGITIDSLLYEGLTRLDKEGKVAPAAAEKWDVSEDGLKWTFHLRKGMKWANGDTVTAKDFAFAWFRALDPKTASEYAYELYYIKGAQEYNEGKGKKEDVAIKITDDNTFEIELNKPTPYLVSLLSFPTYYPVNEKFYNEAGKDFSLKADKIMGNGPYKMQKWTPETNIILVRNDNYWNKDNIHLDELEIKMISDSSAALNAFKNGELDTTELSGEQLAEFQNDKRLFSYNKGSIKFLKFNVKNKLLANQKIREAISLSIDRDELTNAVSKGNFKPAYGFVPEGYGLTNGGDFRKENGDIFEKYNTEKAKQLFQEGLKEVGVTGTPTLTLMVYDAPDNQKIGEYIQEKLRVVLGLDVKVETNTYKIFAQNETQGNYDINLSQWGPDYLDPMTYMDMWVKDGGNNKTNWSSAEYDKLMDTAKSTADNNIRMKSMMDAEKILGKELPIAMLTYNIKNVAVSDRVKDMNFTKIASGYDFYYVDVK